MLDKLQALRYFTIVAETLQFRETAVRCAVSPQVVTRVIAELESELGESLFTRNTRSVKLTAFGERLLPQAQHFLLLGEKLFAQRKMHDSEMAGLVRVALPRLPAHTEILEKLLVRLADYPDISLEWRVDNTRLNLVEQQIDVGLRMGFEAEPNMVVREILQTREFIVAAPELVKKSGGLPENMDDLQERFPLGALLNQETGRAWPWQIGREQLFTPRRAVFATDDVYSDYAAAIAGRACTLLMEYMCRADLASGRLVRLLPELETPVWKMYAYRPYHTQTSARVLRVFEWLAEAAAAQYRVGDYGERGGDKDVS